MRMTMRRMGLTATPHGFRSCMTDWAAERTGLEDTLVDIALGHKVGSEVDRAYRRTDKFEHRRDLMNAWAAFCDGKASGGNVVSIKKTANT